MTRAAPAATGRLGPAFDRTADGPVPPSLVSAGEAILTQLSVNGKEKVKHTPGVHSGCRQC
jgi:hypothetical protein